MSGADRLCKACRGAWPRKDHFIVELGLTKAFLHKDQFFRGWTVLGLNAHTTELFQLSQAERGALIVEVSRMAYV